MIKGVQIPHDLVCNSARTKATIELLKILLKVQEGKIVVSDTKTIKNWIKANFLGYLILSKKEDSKLEL